MPKLLLAPEQRGWPHFQRLMIALLSFLEPYLRNADLTEAIRMLYKVGLLHAMPFLTFTRHWSSICSVASLHHLTLQSALVGSRLDGIYLRHGTLLLQPRRCMWVSELGIRSHAGHAEGAAGAAARLPGVPVRVPL